MGLRPVWSSSSSKKWAFLVLFLSFSSLWQASESDTAGNDVNALFALQLAWGQNALTTLQWQGNDPCGSHWTGISCDNSSPQRVTSIGLSGLGFSGILPSDIGLLAELVSVDLSYNNLNGSIPSQIGLLTQLQVLILQYNQFSGQIPTQIGQLTKLQTLSLNGNKLTGRIPNEIGLLGKLFWFDVAENQLQGSLPFSSDGQSSARVGLDNLTAAQHFHLNNNYFENSIPEAMCHPGMILIHLLLDSNKLEGNIPESLGSCRTLQILKLNNNLLQGQIPDTLGQLANLTELQLSGNNLEGPLPDLSNLINLGLLELSNNQINDYFPSWTASLESLTDLNIEGSHMKGRIPPSFFQLQALTSVELANNSINETLDLSKATSQLMQVSAENNNITLLIPSSNMNNLILRLQGNPVCTSANSIYSTQLCSGNSTAAPTSDGISACPNTCQAGFQTNSDCVCAVPFQGYLIYRAPTFTTLINKSRIPMLREELAENLAVDLKQVEIISATFNAQNQLFVFISIFPNGSSTHWSLDDVIRMSSVLGKDGVSPDGFGPPMFQKSPYDYIVGAPKSGLNTRAIIGISVSVSVLVLVILAVGTFAFLQKRRADKAVERSRPFASWGAGAKDSGAAPKLMGARFFSYAELKKATNNFSESNEVGSGGYGKVYRGIISSGEQVAVKRAQGNSMQGGTEFKNEIELLSRVHHKNIVGLVGFCYEQGEQMLVYEYMAGGSLRDCLTGRGGFKLDWHRRLMIALGAARGIAYLHEMVNPPIIHRDIKSTNILLNEKKIAKVADFGLSKIGPQDGSGKQHVSTQVKGTLGYLDPEYYLSQQITEKSDVYSYGVVMLELLTARAPIEHGQYVVKVAKDAVNRGGLGAIRSMLDPNIRNEELDELNLFVRIALSCLEELATSRPSMGEVVKQLEELVGHDYPESGSSNIEIPKGLPVRHPYSADSELIHISRDSSEPSFPNSASNIPPSFGSK